MAENRVTKLNLGCGIHVCRLPGWENIDNSPNAWLAQHPWLRGILYRMGVLPEELYRVPWPPQIRILDASLGLPFADNSIEIIYTSHMLEHLSRERVCGLIRKVHGVLRPGGIVRVVVPDLEQLAGEYVQATQALARGSCWGEESAPGDKLVSELRLSPPLGRRVWGIPVAARSGSYHHWMYDFVSLKRLLERGGFQQIERRRYLDSAIPEIAELDIAERAEGSLYVEARKGEFG
ncbi:MAG: methyltransferase domain-containing protein [Candidatus Acidoferrales bacterium]